jgi:hypothetical protein
LVEKFLFELYVIHASYGTKFAEIRPLHVCIGSELSHHWIWLVS